MGRKYESRACKIPRTHSQMANLVVVGDLQRSVHLLYSHFTETIHKHDFIHFSFTLSQLATRRNVALWSWYHRIVLAPNETRGIHNADQLTPGKFYTNNTTMTYVLFRHAKMLVHMGTCPVIELMSACIVRRGIATSRGVWHSTRGAVPTTRRGTALSYPQHGGIWEIQRSCPVWIPRNDH